jgi:hypothetical protein
MVVEMMAEMDFIFKRTSYSGMMSDLRARSRQIGLYGNDPDTDSEVAKLAALHEFLNVKNQPASDLPMRLRAIAQAADIMGAWHEVQDVHAARFNASALHT